jgi:NAD/NADP transhydrogenase alpha subunit
MPIPPRGPTRLSKQSWHQYAQNFAVYLHAFNKFNGEMLQHFQARHQQATAREQKGMNWLEAAGDSSVGGGFGSYAREVMEDVRVREAWNMGCERQVDAVKEFDEVKDKVKRLAVAGSLVDQ